ncbi:MAG TPA: glycoside hydrolase family 15 protein [Gammaproteobacteria bacterium]|nr:glycoside hydrolase family 15 protein [Gammaproteobacteria bacterium]
MKLLLASGNPAFGHPGISPRWTHSEKEGVGTAYSSASHVWFTLSHGILNEIYFPTVDAPQTRDLQYLITDGETFFHEEKRDLITQYEYLHQHSLGYRIIQSDPQGRYRIIKEIIADPHYSSVLLHTRVEGDDKFLAKLQLYVILAPRVGRGGWGNTGARVEFAGRTLLTAFKGPVWLALGATVPFRRVSCGYVGASDGWTDLHHDLRLDWEFDCAQDGNIALTGELDLTQTRSFTLGLAFGWGLHGAVTTLLQSLATPYGKQRERFIEQWRRAGQHIVAVDKHSGDNGRLHCISHSLLLAHEDKSYPGALIASMSIPWGEILGDDDGLGGYHLVWTRDLCHSVTALLALGELETPFRALIYLAASQHADGGFYQNFWINGDPYWCGVQLDEVAFPIILAWRLHTLGALKNFDPYHLIVRAAAYLIRHGPATPQERWEEVSGYSPSTLAACIAALICAAQFLRQCNEAENAAFIEDYADFLEAHIEAWTVTTQGTLVPDITRHFIRIHPVNPQHPAPPEDPNHGTLVITNQAPGQATSFPAKAIVDGGFLELVRWGIRPAGDALIEDSLQVVDQVLKVDTPCGPCWRRYNHDGYGTRPDGGAYCRWGQGRAWPLLTGERAHYELAAGRDVSRYIKAMEGFASKGGMLPEQVWDQPDWPERRLYLGRPAGSAMPLMWAHAEYLKLLRSVNDGVIFDRIPAVAARYLPVRARSDLEVWKFNRRIDSIRAGQTLRIQAGAAFQLHWSQNGWATVRHDEATTTGLAISYVDIPAQAGQGGRIDFTFYWPLAGRWEGDDFSVTVH